MNEPARQLPCAIEAEEALLGCILLDGGPTLVKAIGAGLSAADFYSADCRTIFELMVAMHGAQKPLELVAIVSEARGAVTHLALSQLMDRAATTAHAPYFIERIREAAARREVIRRATALVEECFSRDSAAEDLLARASRVGEPLSIRAQDRSWEQAVDEAERLTRERMLPLVERAKSGVAAVETSWGIPGLDTSLQPICAGELVVIGGYTSAGKSSLMRQLMWAAAREGHPVLGSVIEDQDTNEAVNLAGHLSQVRPRGRLDELHPKDQSDLLGAFAKLRIPNLLICHQDMALAQMAARARAFRQRLGGLRLWGIDYLQIMRDVKMADPRIREDILIGNVTSELKRLATELGCAILLLSGFSRDYAKDGKREPRLTDLSGSSHIEKDASRVILLHVPGEYSQGGVRYSQSLTAAPEDQSNLFVQLIQAKGRDTGPSQAALMFRRATKTFLPLAK